MNCFFLSSIPHVCAAMHCDQHVNKMILESAQILSTVLHENHPMSYSPTLMYKPTHKNHPTVKWAAHQQAFWYICALSQALNTERVLRQIGSFRTPHKSLGVVETCARQWEQMYGPMFLGSPAMTHWHPTPKQCAVWSDNHMEDWISDAGGSRSAETLYRIYYANTKTSFKRGPATWTNREKPDWVEKFKFC